MGHYAKVVNGVVEKVIVAKATFFNTFVDDSPGQWIKTSYNTVGGIHYDSDGRTPSADQTKALRGNFAGVGYTYNKELDAFYEPQPYKSWSLNTGSFQWEPPIDFPSGDATGSYFGTYLWDEASLNWITGSIE